VLSRFSELKSETLSVALNPIRRGLGTCDEEKNVLSSKKIGEILARRVRTVCFQL